MTPEDKVVRRVASWCLAYPDDEFGAVVPALRRTVDGLEAQRSRAAAPLRAFLDHVCAMTMAELAEQYVRVFDFKNRHSLYLSWWRDGDTRRRGESLVGFKEAYRRHGFEYEGEELPDFLPVVLEFSAQAGTDELLLEHRAGLELLRLALGEARTPYADVVTAVCGTLPGPSPRDRAEAAALARSGPGREAVGVELGVGVGAAAAALPPFGVI